MTVVSFIRRHEIKKWQWLMAAGCLRIVLEMGFLACSTNQGTLRSASAQHSKQKSGAVLAITLPHTVDRLTEETTEVLPHPFHETQLTWVANRGGLLQKPSRTTLCFVESLYLKQLWQYTSGNKRDIYFSVIFSNTSQDSCFE